MDLTSLRHWLQALPHGSPRFREGLKLALEASSWIVAIVWCVRTRTLMQRLGEVPDLSQTRWDLCPLGAPGLVVVVPAKDEEGTIRPAMETLLAQDYPWIQIVAVNDRSKDATGQILDELAARRPEALGVLHLTHTTEGWLGKTAAMETAARESQSEWLLFTDADVWFSPSLLRRALAFAETSRADHLVIMPSPVVQRAGENFILGFLSVFALWASRPWRVGDRSSRRDAAGAGAFNLIRRSAWEDLGGFEPQRLAVVEDVTLGLRVRAAGLQQRVAFAPGLLLVHWATGVGGLIRGLTKNLFALLNFRLDLAAGFVVFVLLNFFAPLFGLFWPRTILPALLYILCVAVQYRVLAEVTGVQARWGGLFPLGALAIAWAMVRSVAVTLWQGGVRWRETFYPLRELRQHNSPFRWEFEAARQRLHSRSVKRGLHPSVLARAAQQLRRSGRNR